MKRGLEDYHEPQLDSAVVDAAGAGNLEGVQTGTADVMIIVYGPSLPIEIISRIAKYTAANGSYATLAALSATSSRVYDVVLPTMYNTFILTPHSLSFLAAVLSVVHNEIGTAPPLGDSESLAPRGDLIVSCRTSPIARAKLVGTIIVDCGISDTLSDIPLSQTQSHDSAHTESELKRGLFPNAARIILSSRVIRDAMEWNIQQERRGWKQDSWWSYKHPTFTRIEDILHSLPNPGCTVCVHVPDLDPDLPNERVSRLVHDLILHTERLFRTPTSEITFQYHNAPVIPFDPIVDFHVALRPADCHIPKLKDAVLFMIARPTLSYQRLILYGELPSRHPSDEGVQEHAGVDQGTMEDSEFPPLSSPLARGIWDSMRDEVGTTAGEAVGYPVPQYLRPPAPWNDVYRILRDHLNCRPLHRKEDDGVCGFCGTDW